MASKELHRVMTEYNLSRITGKTVKNVLIETDVVDKISYTEDGERVSFLISEFEKKVIKAKLKKAIPSGYKIVLTSDDSMYMSSKCSIDSKNRHMTLTFSYAKSDIVAMTRCLTAILNGVEMGTEIEYDARDSRP